MRTGRLVITVVLLLAACTGIEVAPATTSPPEPPASVSTLPSTTTSPPAVTTPPTTTRTTAVDRPLTGRTVVIDPGHNGRNHAHLDEIGRLVDVGNGTKACNTTGTSTDDGYPEARFTWEVATLAKESLEILGATVVLTRTDNDGWGPCVDARAAVGNEAGADAVVSIHADGGPPEGRGFHVIYPLPVPGLTDDIAADSERLARALWAAMGSTAMPVADYIGSGGFSARDDLGGLNLSDVPAVFLEAGNMRNAADAALLTDPTHQAAIAGAIASAMVAYVSG